MIDGEMVEIPDLKPELLEIIFAAHAAYLEYEIAKEHFTNQKEFPVPQSLLAAETGNGETPFRFGFSTLDGFGAALQHNPNQANAPDIPQDILYKISSIARIVSPETNNFPQPEPHCNCMFCQIAKALHKNEPQAQTLPEETVSDADLTFQEWQITPSGDKMYEVSNENEKYTVYLGDPIGCTCGQSGCAHIHAVLKS